MMKPLSTMKLGLMMMAESAELFYLASQHIEAAAWDEAMERLNELIAKQPENGTAYQQRDLVFLELGKFDDSLSDAEAAVRFEPGDYESYLARAPQTSKSADLMKRFLT